MSSVASDEAPPDAGARKSSGRSWPWTSSQGKRRFDLSQLSPRRLKDSDLDLRNTWQIVAGAVLLPLGIAIVLLGWAGAAHGRVEQQQIPYIISGGVLGLGCIVIGCFFFWAHWLYRIYDQADLHHQELIRQQGELIRALQQLSGRGEPAAAAAASGTTAQPAPSSFVATPAGTNVHTPDCPIVSGRGGTVRQVSAAQAAKMKPCRVCEPQLTK